MSLTTPEKVRKLQMTLNAKAADVFVAYELAVFPGCRDEGTPGQGVGAGRQSAGALMDGEAAHRSAPFFLSQFHNLFSEGKSYFMLLAMLQLWMQWQCSDWM